MLRTVLLRPLITQLLHAFSVPWSNTSFHHVATKTMTELEIYYCHHLQKNPIQWDYYIPSIFAHPFPHDSSCGSLSVVNMTRLTIHPRMQCQIADDEDWIDARRNGGIECCLLRRITEYEAAWNLLLLGTFTSGR
mmetsp:Transcript_38767/g.85114  ORF Transcript_38767/g.85114 Transcript_38767/m.85114 type:complete len:135 (+) Transcript_38767:1341-1745(+)